MAKSTPDIVAFHGGEVDRLTLARADMEGAATRAEIMENIALGSSGAMSLFPGTLHVGETVGGAQTWLRGWTFSPELSYTLEFTAGGLRFVYDLGHQEVDGAAATVGEFTDTSGVPSTGGEAPGEGGDITVTITDPGEWGELKEAFIAIGAFTVSGGNGSYLSPAIVEVLSGQADDLAADIAGGVGFIAASDADGSAVTYRIRVQDTAGNFGYSGTGSIAAAPE